MVNYTILAGGFSTFIVSYLFNSGTGSLTIQGNSTTGENPSWIALHPTDKTILYATNEIAEKTGALQSFTVGDKGVLTVLDTVSSGGIGPAFATPLSTGQVPVMNFGSGDGLVVPSSSASPPRLDHSASLIKFPVPAGGNSRPHGAYEFGKEIFVPDLGADTIHRLVEDGSSGTWKIAGGIKQAPGSGPRHLVIKDSKVFTLHETDNTLTIQTIPADSNSTATLLASVSIVPDDNAPPGAKFAAAEVLFPNPLPGNKPYVYASNRNIGVADPRGDAIVIFEHVTGQDVTQRRWHRRATDQLVLTNVVHTGLQQIRSMMISNDGQYLVAGGANGGGVNVYQIADGGKSLVGVASNAEVDTRSSFVWL